MNWTYTEAASVVGSELWISITRAVARRGKVAFLTLCRLLQVHIHGRGVAEETDALLLLPLLRHLENQSLLIRPRYFLCSPRASCAPCSLWNPLSTSNTPLSAVEEATAVLSCALIGDAHQLAGVAGYCIARKCLWTAGSQQELVQRAACEASPVRNSL